MMNQHPPTEQYKSHGDEENDYFRDDNSSTCSDPNQDDDPNMRGATIKDQAAQKTKQTLARKETRAVSLLRWVFVLVLISTAVAVSVVTYYYSRGVEEDAFQSDFDSVAAVTQRSFVEAVESRLNALDALSTGITAHANEVGEVFPNVTVPDWEVKGATVRVQTDGIYLFWLPLVTDETRAGYEAYTQLKQGQLFQSYGKEEMYRQYQDMFFNISTETGEPPTSTSAENGNGRRELHVGDTLPGPDFHQTIHEGIWGLHARENPDGSKDWIELPNTGPYLPCWQLSPVIPLPALLNFNFYNYNNLAPMMNRSLETGKTTLGYLQTEHEGSETENLINTFMYLNQYRHDEEHYTAKTDPMTHVSYPVFNSNNPMDRNVSGLAVTTILWRHLLQNILADNIKGVFVVLKNTLGEATTYRIDGKTASLVGKGDLHDKHYDHMGFVRHISDYLAERANSKTNSYTAVGLDDGYTSYSIEVYPSSEMEDQYVTKDPIIYAAAVGCVFVFTSLLFMAYDFLVEKRQAMIMDTAVKSKAVVTSLFPEAVHERLFADPSKSEEFSKQMAWKNNHTMNNESQITRPSGRMKNRPIADKFENVTVLFADLAGFTAWSSTRTPEDVFVLLETLYGAFDAIALRKDVFKVETIGDCYMACTGIPHPQADHAPRMVKFARDCMLKMKRLLEEDLGHLGADTKTLGFRVGMHSGPVTAGVLRGDKGRFQLFGDTVNTASRMESHGIKGKIQCSPSTAALLPERWLTPREDKIVAKGKGEMQTYWVEASSRAQSASAYSSSFGSTDADDEEGEVLIQEMERAQQGQRRSFLHTLQNGLNVNTNFREELVDDVFHSTVVTNIVEV